MNEKINSEFVKTEISVMQNEISGDYILPDSYPDVKNILSCTARISEMSKYTGANEFETDGSIVYNIMFSASVEGGDIICSVSFNEHFKNICKYKNAKNSSSGMQTRIRDVTCRMVNPRRFSLKAIFENTLFENISVSAYPTLSDPDDASMQYKYAKATLYKCKSAQIAEHSYSDNVEIDIKLPEIIELVHYDVILSVRDERIIEQDPRTPKLGASFALSALYKDADGKYHSVSRELPFGITLNANEISAIGDIDADSVIVPSPCLAALNINIGKNQYGEAKIIELDADYDIDLLIFTSEEISYVTDAYSTEYASECKYENEILQCPYSRIKNNFTYSDARERSALGLESSANVISMSGKPCDIHIENIGENIAVVGKINEKAVAVNEDSTIKGNDIPFSFNYKTNSKLCNQPGLLGGAVISDGRVRQDADKIYVDCELYIDCALTSKNSYSLCKSVALTEKKQESKKGLFSIYYPAPDDTLWDIAKKMQTTGEKLCSLNAGLSSKTRINEPIIIE